jgi:uncharacterized membrane protein required for colicin V production
VTTADILLLLIIAGAFLIGFFWGVLRGLLALAAWAVVFVLSAHLSGPLGDYLTNQWRNFSPEYDHMLAYLILFGLLFALSMVLIQIGVRESQDLTRYQLFEDVLSGLLLSGVALLVTAAVMAILGTFYGSQPAAAAGAQWTADLQLALKDSTLGGQLAGSLVPMLEVLLGPLVPDNIRAHL